MSQPFCSNPDFPENTATTRQSPNFRSNRKFPGSSEYFLGSVTAYSNQLKTSLLNVPNDIIQKFRAVSEEVALEMAKGVRAKTGADIGISTTGISGPSGGTKTKPVGLVYIGVVTPEKSMVKKYNFNYGRNIHREMTTTAALNITRLAINQA